jgi:hypothetical protein
MVRELARYVIFVPHKMHPGNILFVKKLMKVL